MTKYEYLSQRISDLEKSVNDESVPLKIRQIQQLALINYRMDLEAEIKKSGK